MVQCAGMELAVQPRDTKKNPNTLRREGLMPAVVYGRKTEATPIAVDRKTFERLFSQAGESTVITLTGLSAGKQALIHDVDLDPVSGHPLHADFYAIEKGQTVTVAVPLEFIGTSAAVKDLGGILTKVMHELEIEVDATELPQAIEVDISKLATLEDQIKVADLTLPASAKLSVDPDEVVAMISVAQEESAEAPAMDITQIETSVERGKKEEEAAPEGEAKE